VAGFEDGRAGCFAGAVGLTGAGRFGAAGAEVGGAGWGCTVVMDSALAGVEGRCWVTDRCLYIYGGLEMSMVSLCVPALILELRKDWSIGASSFLASASA